MVPNDDDPFDFDKNIDEPLSVVELRNKEDNKKDDKKDNDDDSEEDDDDDSKKKDDDDDDFSFDQPDDKKKKAEDKKDDDSDDSDDGKKKKKTKDDSLADLRKQRDTLKEQNDKIADAIGSHDVAVIKQVRTFIDENFEDDIPTEDAVIAFLDDAKQVKEENEKLKKELSNRDNRIKDLDIRQSSEFNEQFIQPLQDAASDLQVEIANLDAEDGEVLAPEATRLFHSALMKEEKVNSTKVKQLLTKFAKDFKQESGQDYDAPSVASVMTAYRGFKSKNDKMMKAYREWETEKKTADTKSQKLSEEQRLTKAKQDRDERKAGAIKALRGFDLEKIEGIQDKSELEKTVRQTFMEHEDIFKDPSKLPTYDVTMERAVKAKLFDLMSEKYSELLEWKKSQEEEDDDEAKGKGSKKKADDGEDWLPGDF